MPLNKASSARETTLVTRSSTAPIFTNATPRSSFSVNINTVSP